jgi:pyroglutamyl-peptidase
MASLPHDLIFLPHLPVDVQLASSRVITKINELQPDYIICCGICCGMAASRSQLSVEVLARGTSISINSPENIFQTSVDLEKLLVQTAAVEISHDCGKFVCEGLYYSVLGYLHHSQPSIKCIFVHVPILNPENSLEIIADFILLINNLTLL